MQRYNKIRQYLVQYFQFLDSSVVDTSEVRKNFPAIKRAFMLSILKIDPENLFNTSGAANNLALLPQMSLWILDLDVSDILPK